jgi:RNA polymerase sigma-70 factor (ECF subfamily)
MNTTSRIKNIELAYPRLKKYSHILEKKPENAEDLLHDTIIKMIEKENQFDGEKDYIKWGFSVMHNLFIDEKRRYKSNKNIHTQYFSEIERFDYPASFDQPRDLLIKYKFKIIKEKLKLKKNEKHYELFILRSMGFSYKEISVLLNITVSRVKGKMHDMKLNIINIDINKVIQNQDFYL